MESFVFMLTMVTHLRQTCHREAEGERDAHDIRRIRFLCPRDTGSAAYEDQQKRA